MSWLRIEFGSPELDGAAEGAPFWLFLMRSWGNDGMGFGRLIPPLEVRGWLVGYIPTWQEAGYSAMSHDWDKERRDGGFVFP